MKDNEIQKFIDLAEKANKEKSSRIESNLEKFCEAPHCWLLGAVMDRGIPFEKAWNIPYEIASRKFNGSVDFEKFASLTLDEYYQTFNTPPYLHRFKKIMAEYFYLAVMKIRDEFDSDANNIWNGNKSSFEVISNLKEFKGIGDKISTMCCNILYRDLKINFSDLKAINVSPDVHVQRVFYRLGLTNTLYGNPKACMEVAKKLNPDYPGIFDLICWVIGEDRICVNDINKCECTKCKLNDICCKRA